MLLPACVRVGRGGVLPPVYEPRGTLAAPSLGWAAVTVEAAV